MVVVAQSLLYDVADPINPRLVCRGTETAMHLIDGNSVAYTTVAGGHVVIVKRNLTTGAESRVAQLRVAPGPYYYGRVGWTWDGLTEVYPTSTATSTSTTWTVTIHLWSNGADHVLYRIQAGQGGLESRWSPRPILDYSPDKKYVAISDFGFAIYGSNIRIFALADLRQKFVVAVSSSGGTWIANDRFAWADLSGSLKQWTPTTGATVLRSDHWYGVTAGSDGKWLAGTILDPGAAPRVFIAPVGVGRTYRTGLASSPGFITPTVVWYEEEKQGPPGYDPTVPGDVIHALDVVSQTDRIVHFHTGQAPKDVDGNLACCSTQY